MNLKAVLTVFSSALLSAALASGAKAAAENNCLSCHARLMQRYSTPTVLYEKDIHQKAGLICSDCHGGDPEGKKWHGPRNPAQGFLGAPAPAEIPTFCDRCHGNVVYMRSHNLSLPVDQLVKYRTSRHGELLLGQGDIKAASCVSCHSVHDIRQVGDPGSSVYPVNLPGTCAGCHADAQYMAGYGIPTDQFAKFAGSVHGVALLERGDVGAPACNDCHGNHGAIPPEVDHISQVCGLCHVNNEKLYRESFHAEIFKALGSPDCETCHGNHGIRHPDESFLGAGENSVCGNCHEQSRNDAGFALGLAMRSILDSLAASLSATTGLVEKAEQLGMETSELSLSLRDVRQSLIEARTMIHSFDDTEVSKAAQPGVKLALELKAGALDLLSEHKKRRWWLGGISLIVLALIAGLYLKLREIEK
ncbi:MAG TPA: cytochrome c3 family protein [archaeon]|nr:cytochrome c3 family protein [archaeon]